MLSESFLLLGTSHCTFSPNASFTSAHLFFCPKHPSHLSLMCHYFPPCKQIICQFPLTNSISKYFVSLSLFCLNYSSSILPCPLISFLILHYLKISAQSFFIPFHSPYAPQSSPFKNPFNTLSSQYTPCIPLPLTFPFLASLLSKHPSFFQISSLSVFPSTQPPFSILSPDSAPLAEGLSVGLFPQQAADRCMPAL